MSSEPARGILNGNHFWQKGGCLLQPYLKHQGMHVSALALIGFACWTAILALSVVTYRGLIVVRGEKQIHEFPADRDHGGPEWYRRLARAHMNALENLPLFAVVILLAIVSDQTSITDPFAFIVLALRILQSIVHVFAGGPIGVTVRFSLYAAQSALVIYMGAMIALRFL